MGNRKRKFNMEMIQDLLDEGLSFSEIERQTGISKQVISYNVIAGNLEVYIAFDETGTNFFENNLDWLEPDDILEDILMKGFDVGFNLSTLADFQTEMINERLNQLQKTLPEYIRYKKWEHLLEEITKECTKCGEVKPISQFYERMTEVMGLRKPCKECLMKQTHSWQLSTGYRKVYYRENKDSRHAYAKRWIALNKDRHKIITKAAYHRRRTMILNLDSTLTSTEWGEILSKEFSGKCALTGSDNVALEHFIPVSWGHGGTYVGNVYPLDKSLNSSKNNKNPFEWIKERDDIDIDRFNKVVAYLAKLNGLTIDEYRQFVYWCYENQRSAEYIKNDKRHSIKIWRENTNHMSQFSLYV